MTQGIDLRIREGFFLASVNSIAEAIRYVFERSRTPEAIEFSRSDWYFLENLAQGLGSNPAFLRFPIYMADYTAIVCKERADDYK